ncbi:hypothetical protein EJ110_NYTH46492 [Nymphaea thermarum]|nr:hypothetical protein EJ110_NYTH46492 [Nymphaea thermarum]
MHRGGSSTTKKRGASTISQGRGRTQARTIGTGGGRVPTIRLSIRSGSIKNFSPIYVVAGAQPEIRTAMCSKDIIAAVDDTIGRWFYDTSIPFNTANSFNFQTIADVIASVGRGYKMPAYLCHIAKDVKAYCDELKFSWKDTGCSIMADRWTNIKNRTLSSQVWDVFGDCGVFLSPTVAAAPIAAAASTAVVAPTAVVVTAVGAPTAISATIARDAIALRLRYRPSPALSPIACAIALRLHCRPSPALSPLCRCLPPRLHRRPLPCFCGIPLSRNLLLDADCCLPVINLRLTKENYFSWSPAMTMGIAGRGRMAYIDGSNPEPARTSGAWHTWFLEDNQVKTWIVNSVSADIQPLILRKKTVRDMWVVLEQMHEQKKTAIRTYQIMKTVYGLRQGNSSVADYYGALKAKWEELDYHSDIPWHCPQDQALHVAQEWENMVFLFLVGLNDEFEGVRSQILNSGEVSSIEDVYSCVEAEEQRRLVTNEGKRDLVPYHERFIIVSRGPGGPTRSLRKCTHCKKTGHTVDYCWDLHPEKKGNKGRSSIGKTLVSEVQQELLQMQQGDMDLTEYFTKLKFAYEKMNSLKPPCKHCLKSHMEQMIVVKFLAGLSSDYSASKAQMLTGSDFPDLDEAFNRLNRLAVTLPPSSNNMQSSALASFGGGRGGLYSSRGRGRGRGPGGRGRLQCTFCGRLGHLEDRCWNKVGKPNTSTSPFVTSSSSSTPNTRPITLAPKANPTVASVDATSLNLSPAEIDLIMEHRSNATPSTSSASTVVTSSAYSADLLIKAGAGKDCDEDGAGSKTKLSGKLEMENGSGFGLTDG